MSTAFFATLTPMLTMFLCIAIGFTLRKKSIIPDNSGKVLSKLVNWVFSPALTFSTMSRYCTLETMKTHGMNILLSGIAVLLAILISITLVGLFAKKSSPERGVYKYALAFANSGYMGDPVVQMLHGSEVFSYYKLFCLPVTVGIYSWGMSCLVPKESKSGGLFKRMLNPPIVATFLGIIVGLSGLGAHMPNFLNNTFDTLKVCMGPSAMIVAGVTIANYNVSAMLKNKKVYIASILRLTLIPAMLIATIFGVKELINLVFDAQIDNNVLYLLFFATATPLGLNTVVFPEAYGGNPETGASMTMISHTLCVATIPLFYALLTVIFGPLTL